MAVSFKSKRKRIKATTERTPPQVHTLMPFEQILFREAIAFPFQHAAAAAAANSSLRVKECLLNIFFNKIPNVSSQEGKYYHFEGIYASLKSCQDDFKEIKK